MCARVCLFLCSEDMPFIGADLPPETAHGVARGYLHPSTHEAWSDNDRCATVYVVPARVCAYVVPARVCAYNMKNQKIRCRPRVLQGSRLVYHALCV